MQIKINLKIFIFMIVFYFTKQIEIYGILMLFAFLHELGHLLAGILLGFKPESLKVNPLGLSINFKIQLADYNGKVKKRKSISIKKINNILLWTANKFSYNVFGFNTGYRLFWNRKRNSNIFEYSYWIV